MKTNRLFQLLTLVMCAVAFAFVTSCEGPVGPAGPAGTNGTNGTDGLAGINGVDANETCKICHNESTEGLNAKQSQFVRSQHAVGTYWDRDGECAACHNTEGFLARQGYTDEYTEAKAFVGAQSAISCYTCHSLHQAYDADDWALTYPAQVTATFLGHDSPDYAQISFKDYGSSNLCMNCHQARDRGDVPAVDATTGIDITISHWGPHYGVQGNVLHSSGGVNVAGAKTYPPEGNGHAGSIADVSCTDCHMFENKHTLEINFAACVACHTDEDTAEGKVDVLQTEIHDSMFALGALLAGQGVMTINYEEDGITVAGYSPKGSRTIPTTVTAAQSKGIWNYMTAYQDHSYGVHNPSYMRALLQNSIDDNTP